ncbi:MAG: hypothetical protein WC138_10170, partial [Methanoculleus sp.]
PDETILRISRNILHQHAREAYPAAGSGVAEPPPALLPETTDVRHRRVLPTLFFDNRSPR